MLFISYKNPYCIKHKYANLVLLKKRTEMSQKDKTTDQLDNIKDSPKREHKFLKFLWKHKYYVGLILIIITIFRTTDLRKVVFL